MSWIRTTSLTAFQKFCMNILKCGPVPQHIAFIMDGNRRYAKKTHVEKTIGHSKGFEKLAECLQWCKELGVKEVTVYAFSIENFKRSPSEVDALLQLAHEKFTKLFDERDRLMEEGVCIRIIGNFELLPDSLRTLFAKAVLLTKNNNKAILNVAFAYTSRDEIASSIHSIIEGVNDNNINAEDISEELISYCLYTNQSPNPEVLVRTSGEVRLSDFLLWQISRSSIFFTEVLWPEFSVWHLFACVFKYQRSLYYSKHVSQQSTEDSELVLNPRVASFLEVLNKRRYSQLEAYAAA